MSAVDRIEGVEAMIDADLDLIPCSVPPRYTVYYAAAPPSNRTRILLHPAPPHEEGVCPELKGADCRKLYR